MGQGYSLTTLSAGSAGIDVPELSNLSYEKSLGDARFMKAIRARHREGLVIAKVVMKPYTSMEFGGYISKITLIQRAGERNILADIPNALPYHRAFETSSNGYLLRQYVHSSLYDRMSTRPFLGDIEKRWIAFQLLSAVRDIHARDVFHGDIKSENVLVTSWDWAYLADFSASFKPTYLPEDNPADFSFYFDISGRRTCYLAPERFVPSVDKAENKGNVTWAMDIFSTGCVIAELFLETPIFNLSQLFKYKNGEYDPILSHINRIEDSDIRELVTHMIQVDPESRYSADEYLNFWRRRTFPEYFYTFLHQYMFLITDPTSGHVKSSTKANNFGESDERIDRVYYDFDKIAYFLGYEDDPNQQLDSSVATTSSRLSQFPLHLDIPNKQHVATSQSTPSIDDGTLLFLNLVTSALRSSSKSTTRVRACELLLAFAERSTDDAKLDRILPFVMYLLSDRVDIVRVAALRTLTQLVALVVVASPINAYVFPEYILPKLESFAPSRGERQSTLVRSSYATCLSTLADTATRFLDVIQSLKAEGSLPTTQAGGDIASMTAYRDLFDVARADLLRFFELQTTTLLTDASAEVRRAFLASVSALCVFFGSAKSNDVILTHLNTYLNDRDWKLKCAFFDTIVGVATYVGGTSLEDFILPLMIPALTDPEEAVVEKVLRSLSTMAQLGLFERAKSMELFDLVTRFTMHSNIWIREAAASFLSNAIKYLSIADIECTIKPRLTPYLKTMLVSFSEVNLLDAFKRPLSRAAMDLASTWVSKADRGIFWKAAQQQISALQGLDPERVYISRPKDFVPNALNKFLKNEEDSQWIKALRNVGMGSDDDFKLLALREYIWAATKRRSANDGGGITSKLNGIIPLKDLGITPVTVFFEHHANGEAEASSSASLNEKLEKPPQSITDALLDASSSLTGSANEQNTSTVVSRPTSVRSASQQRSLAVPVVKSSPRRPSPLGSSPRPGVEASSPSGSTYEDSRTPPGSLKNKSQLLQMGADLESLSPQDRLAQTRHNHSLHRRGSAIDLMHKQAVIGKALAETSTSSTTAFGMTDGMFNRETKTTTLPVEAKDESTMQPPSGRYSASHSYKGTDTRVLRLLDSIYIENYPVDLIEFGPLVTPVKQRQWEKRASPADSAWRPEGSLVATFGEHSAAIVRVVVAPDHSFFITGSEDGSVKVWDSARLERNLANRARQTYKHEADAKVTSLCFVENTHCFISGASDGSLHIVKVDFSTTARGATKYGKLKLLRRWVLPEKASHAVWIEQFTADGQSTLIVATNTSQIHGINLRTMQTLYTLNNPVKHGTPTSFCIDPERHWLLVGTSHGVLSLWDLRFRLRIRSWALPAAAPIHRVCNHPVPKEDVHRVIITGGTGLNDVTVWNLDRTVCTEVYRTASLSSTAPDVATSLRPYVPRNPDTEAPGAMLSHFPSLAPPSANTPTTDTDIGVRALAVGTYTTEPGTTPTRQRDASHGFFVAAGGVDRRVRFWDMGRVEASRIVSGLGVGEAQPGFATRQVGSECVLCEEKAVVGVGGDEAGRRGEGRERPSRGGAAAVAARQQLLMRSHLDAVTDVAVLEYPFGMVVSVDRSGVIYVFQ